MKEDFIHLLLGKDRRSINGSSHVVELIKDQQGFDDLFVLLFHHERTVVMRAADAVEKITHKHPAFLEPHKQQLLSLLHSAVHIELKWHVAQLLPRISLDNNELREVWKVFTYWAQNPNESKIVRVNSLQGLFELSHLHPQLKKSFEETMNKLEHDPIPSIQARIRKLKKKGR